MLEKLSGNEPVNRFCVFMDPRISKPYFITIFPTANHSITIFPTANHFITIFPTANHLSLTGKK
jgi:hypothetical protein